MTAIESPPEHIDLLAREVPLFENTVGLVERSNERMRRETADAVLSVFYQTCGDPRDTSRHLAYG